MFPVSSTFQCNDSREQTMRRRTLLYGLGGVAVAAAAGAGMWRYSTGSMSDYDAYQAALRAPLKPAPDVDDIVRHATLAANSHNTQAWRFTVSGDVLALGPDVARRTPVVDPDDHHLYVSLGCAAANMELAARAAGRAGTFMDTPPDQGMQFALSTSAPEIDPLFEAIGQRQSTRGLYDGRPVGAADLDILARQSAVEGVRMVYVTARAQMNLVRDLVIEGNTRQIADPAFVSELLHWLRFNPRAAMETGDGLFAAASGNPVLPDGIGATAFRLAFGAQSENDKYLKQIDSSAGLVVFLADKADPAHWMKVGRACQRFALAATRAGLKHAFVNQPVEVPALRSELAALVGEPDKRPDIVMRFGYGPLMPFAPRRPVKAVLS
jgi:hypothetical protein